MMVKILLLMGGGALGTLLRYFTFEITKSTGEINFIGTFFVNLIGSFLIGLLWGFYYSTDINPNVKNFLFVGMLGGYTTFSAFALDVVSLSNSGDYKTLFVYLLGTNILALLLVFGGFLLGKLISTS